MSSAAFEKRIDLVVKDAFILFSKTAFKPVVMVWSAVSNGHGRGRQRALKTHLHIHTFISRHTEDNAYRIKEFPPYSPVI